MFDQESSFVKPLHLLNGTAALVGLYLASRYSYLLFHSLVEIFSVIVACGIFIIAWNTRRILNNNYFLFVGIASLFVGTIDLLHMLAYKGMAVFPGYGPNLATQLWIVGRYLQSFSLFVAPIFLIRKLRGRLAMALFLIVTALLLAAVFVDVFPDCFVEGRGLTPFKKGSEYLISFMLGGALFFLRSKEQYFDRQVMRLISGAIALFIASELAFTIYTDVYGISNMIGHFLKLAGFYLMYKALIETGLVKPYDLLFREIKESETKYRALFENMIDGFALHQIVVDDKGKPVDYIYLEVNSAFEKLTGLKAGDILNKQVTQVLPDIEQDPGDWIGVYGKVALAGNELRFEQYFDLLGKWYAVMVYSPTRNYIATVFEDISERKKGEESLRESEARMTVFAEATFEGIVKSEAGLIVDCNEQLARMLGYSVTELKGMAIAGFIAPEDLDQVMASIRQEQKSAIEHAMLRKDGTRIVVEAHGRSLSPDSAMRHTAIRDITGRKRAEEALRKAHVELELRIQERTRELKEANETLEKRVLERTAELQAANATLRDSRLAALNLMEDAVAARTQAEVTNLDLQLEIAERKRAEEALRRAHDELELRVRERTEELATAVETLLGEMAERERAEGSLQRLNRLYAVLSETNQAIVRARDRDSLFRDFCSIAVEHGKFLLSWVGLIDEESGRVKILAASGALSYLEDIRITTTNGPAGEGPTGISIREGTYFICNDFQSDPCTGPWHEKGRAYGICASASIALKEEDRVIGALTLYAGVKDFFDPQHVALLRQMGEDISFALGNFTREARRREMEQALREETLERLRVVEALREKEQMLLQQSRLAAMGEMINNIAHQWRQPLNTLGLTVQSSLLFYDLGDFNREFLRTNTEDAMKLIKHMSQTIDDFRNFFRSDKEKTDFSVKQAIQLTLSLIEHALISNRIEIVTKIDGEPLINGYYNEFSQVLLNILQNASDVLMEREIARGKVTITSAVENGRTVVTITDNAGGIPEELLVRIFEPYFSTKGVQGTGIGLFMSKNIIETNMGGSITARNTAQGAEFRIEV